MWKDTVTLLNQNIYLLIEVFLHLDKAFDRILVVHLIRYLLMGPTWFIVLWTFIFLFQAKKFYESALRLEPGYLGAALALAELHVIEGRNGDAVSLLERYLKDWADDSLHVKLAQVYAATNLLQEALSHFQAALRWLFFVFSFHCHFHSAISLTQCECVSCYSLLEPLTCIVIVHLSNIYFTLQDQHTEWSCKKGIGTLGEANEGLFYASYEA